MTTSLTRQNLGFDFESPAYRFGPLETTASNVLCVPIIYGRIKAAGNKIWQSSGTTTFSALVAFGEGQISSITNVQLNNYNIANLTGCSYSAYVGDGTQQIDSRVTGNTQADKAALVGGLKYTAYIALTVAASTKVTNNYLNVTADIVGKLVRVYTDTSTYTTQYSNNPAWCIFDFLTCSSACDMPVEDLDIQSFITAANYCDVKVNPVNATGTVSVAVNSNVVTGSGTKFITEIKIGDQITVNNTNKIVTVINSDTSLTVDSNFSTSLSGRTMIIRDTRYTINLILDERKSRVDWIKEMLTLCRGYLLYDANQKISLVIEQDSASVQDFTPDNIISRSEYFWTTPKNQKCDILKVRYIYPTEQCARVFAVAESDTFSNDPPTIQEVQALGVTNFKQASRLAWFYLNQSNNCNKFISFRTTQISLDRMVGDVITLTSTFLGYVKKKMRIVQIAQAQDGQIQIICREYNGAESATLTTNLTGSNNDLVFSSVVKAESADDITVKYTDPYNPNQALNISISGNDINVLLATDSSGAIITTAAQIITAIQASTEASILVTVANVTGSDGSGIVKSMAKTNLAGGTVGIYSDTLGSVEPEINMISINDNLDIPDDIQNFSSAQNLNTVVLSWQQIPDGSVTYEIRHGSSWLNSQVVAQDLTTSTYTVLNIQKGTYHYWIAAKNKYGTYSTNPKLSLIVVNDIPETNSIVNENILDSDISQGTLVNCYSLRNEIILESDTDWASSGSWENLGNYYVLNGYWGASCFSSGTYTTKIYDLNASLSCIIGTSYNVYSIDDLSDIVAEWKYSTDNVIWTDWQIFSQGNYTFRYYQFRITINSPNNISTALTSFVINVDVTNRDLYFYDQVISTASSGITVNFNPTFIAIPSVVANISDGTNGYCVVSAKNTSQATVKAYDNSGTAITAKVDIRVKGY